MVDEVVKITFRQLYAIIEVLLSTEEANGNHSWSRLNFRKFYAPMRRAAGSQEVWEAVALWAENHGLVRICDIGLAGDMNTPLKVDLEVTKTFLNYSDRNDDRVLEFPESTNQRSRQTERVYEICASPASHPGSHRCWKCGTGGDRVNHCPCGGFFLPIICVCDEIGDGPCAQHDWEGRVKEQGGVIQALESTSCRDGDHQGYFVPGFPVRILEVSRADREDGKDSFIGKIGMPTRRVSFFDGGYGGILNFWPSDEPVDTQFKGALMELVREPIKGLDTRILAVLKEIGERFNASQYVGPDPLLILQARARVSLADWKDVPEHYSIFQKHEPLTGPAMEWSPLRKDRYNLALADWHWPRPVNRHPTPAFYKALLDQLRYIKELPNYIES